MAKRSPKRTREINAEKVLLLTQAAEYQCTPYEWVKACKRTEKYDGSVAVCTLRVGHKGLCIYTVPKKHTDAIHQEKLYNLKQKEKDMAKKTAADETTEKPTKKRGNPEALAKAREAGAAGREEARKRKIKLLTKENPKREGSASRERFALYRTGMTVGEFLDAGGASVDVAYDIKHGYIEVK